MTKKKPQNEKDKKIDIKGLQEKLVLAEKERDEYLNGWKRAKADLANFKKETAEAILELKDVVGAGFVKNLLPVLEAFEESEKNNIEGLSNIWELLFKILDKEGVETIFPKEGDKFNPEFHEAIEGEGTVVDEVFQRGYKLKDRVVKPAKVKVMKT